DREDGQQHDRDETGDHGGDLRRPLRERISVEDFPGAAEGGLRFHGRPQVRQPRPARRKIGTNRWVYPTLPILTKPAAVARRVCPPPPRPRESAAANQAKSRSSNRISPNSSAIALYRPA